MPNDYSKVGLYNHNINSYEAIRKSFENGEKVAAIVHSTGTGKSYNGLQFSYDNKNKKILWLVPTNSIIEHIKNIIIENKNLTLEDFGHVQFATYQSLVNMSRDELTNLKIDVLIVDELHHLGAPVWSSRVETIIATHNLEFILGMTAYTVRDRGTSYERDMAKENGNELFSNKIVSRYDLCDAMIDGILPKPIYKSSHINLMEILVDIEEKIKNQSNLKKDYLEQIEIAKKRIIEAPGIKELIKKNIKQNGKYIYFCPPYQEEGTNDIETIMNELRGWLEEYIEDEKIIFYKTTSQMKEEGKKNREAFYNDTTLDGKKVDGKLRIMFVINQYNEGVHVPNVDGVILGRATSSDIVYFEQIGRALNVRGNAKEKYEEYENKSIEELKVECLKRDIKINDEISKEEIIEKLIAPIILDLTDNYEYIKELENNLKDRIKNIQKNQGNSKRKIKIKEVTFDIDMENQELYEMLNELRKRLTNHWDEMYEFVKNYYKHHGNLEIPVNFKTTNGYEYNEAGYNLGAWIITQRRNKNLSEARKQKLLQIGMRFENIRNVVTWDDMYELTKNYYKYHGNLEIPVKFKTINGYEYNEAGYNLGVWIAHQRCNKNLNEARKQKLLQIGMRFENIRHIVTWDDMYELTKNYYKYHGNLEIPVKFKTINGHEYNEAGYNLGVWIAHQRSNKNLNEEHKQKLLQIGMRFENIKNMVTWDESYDLAQNYYKYHGNLEIPVKFKTINGYEYNEAGYNLGTWIVTQRSNKNLSENKRQKLNLIGMIWNIRENKYKIVYICRKYNIDINKNKNLLEHISYQELSLKIWYLVNNHISICNDDGLLHEIFSMSDINMKIKYQISLEEILQQSNLEENKGKYQYVLK